MKFFIRFAKLTIIPAFILYFIYNLSEQYLSNQIQEALRSQQSSNLNLWTFGSLQFLLAILFPMISILLVSFCLDLIQKNKSFQLREVGSFVGENSNYLLIESLRCWGSILKYGLFLIIPGMFRYLQLIFTPLIVTLSSDYHEGKVDALQLSSELFKKNIFKIIGILLIFEVVIPMTLSSLTDEYRNFSDYPLIYLGLNLADTVLFLVSIFILYKIYQNSTKKDPQDGIVL